MNGDRAGNTRAEYRKGQSRSLYGRPIGAAEEGPLGEIPSPLRGAASPRETAGGLPCPTVRVRRGTLDSGLGGRIASSVGPDAPAAGLPKDKARKVTSSATTCDDLGVLVDRSHSLPPDYVPRDLVPLRDYGVPTLGSEVLRREAAEHLGRLVEGAAADGEKLVVASAYRSYENQQRSHESLRSVLGAGAGRLSATAGHSQHQLGTAVDFTDAAAGYKLGVPFARTSGYRWLEQHAWEYGFVLAYPRGEEERTGYRWEPWHYRYVGVRDAKRIEHSGQSLQEFLERVGTTPHC
jgi:zinc D-Ala-D-Ala carboxypeptidase